MAGQLRQQPPRHGKSLGRLTTCAASIPLGNLYLTSMRSVMAPTSIHHFAAQCRRNRLTSAMIFFPLLLVTVAGCGGSDLPTVTGRVTLDGAPLPNAFVEFVPTEGQGSTSSGRTDEAGEYDL